MNSIVARYGLALAAMALAILIRLAVDPWLGEQRPFMTLYAAVALAVWFGGLVPATLAAIVGYVAAHLLFVDPPPTDEKATSVLIGFGGYVFSCGVIIALGAAGRASQARAEQSHASFNRLADAMPQLVWTARANGLVDYYNARRSNYQRPNALPDEWDLMVHPDDRAATRAAWAAAHASGQPYEMEHRILMRDGSYRWHLSRALPAHDVSGQVVRWYGTATDIDGLKRVEAALKETSASLVLERERLAVALRTGKMGFYEWRVGTTDLWWSPELYIVYGVNSSEFEATIASFTALIHPDDRDDVWRRTHECIERREVFVHEYRIVPPDGEVRWVYNRSHVAVDEAGNVERIVGVAIDVTERKRAEALLLEADRRKDEFIATLAHELRNPLAPIRNAVRLLGSGGDAPIDTTWARDVIERQVSHMARLLDDLLDISRISLGRVELQSGRVTLASVVDMAIETSHPAIERGRHRLVVQLPGQPVWLQADAVRLAQVLSNLLNNAAKYTEPGGHIRLEAVLRASNEVVITVSDDGIGIAPEQLARVFEMFAQAQPALDRSQGGLGIGLALARGLTEAMGGRIEAESDGPGRGSRFSVHLPVHEVEAVGGTALPGQADQSTNAPSPGARVLIADDLRDSADSLALLLESVGHEVRVAYDGAEACVVAEAFQPQVALLDLGMPKLNGYEVCRRIRDQPWGSDVCVIALTGWGEEEARRRTGETGFDLHMVKPVDLDALLQVVQRSRCSLRGHADASIVAR
ncbi:MAG TPA: PAS domain-containing protein [Steroidobacteraceae bacterium]|nr:PAS domain-containing protein [Steroidobacteraceae bacterium]